MCNPIRRGRRIEVVEPATDLMDNRWLWAGGGITLTRWRCFVRFEEPTEEHVRGAHTLAFVHHGSYLLESARGRGLVDPTTVGLYNPGEPFRGAHPQGPGDRGTTLLVPAETVRRLVARHRPRAAEADAAAFPATAGHRSPRAALLHRLLVAAVESRQEPLAVEEAAHRLLDELAASLFEPGRRPACVEPEDADPRPYVERAARHLLLHFREPVQVADVARAAYTSPFHLCRLFKARTGTTLHGYLSRLRLQAALDALAERPRLDLAQLAQEVGFATHSHFTAAFRRELGATPSAVRRALASPGRARELRARLGTGGRG